jgi:hypothetical protein
MATDPIHDDDLEGARRAFRAAAAWQSRVPLPVREAQSRVGIHLRRMGRSGFDQDSFDALLESWRVIDAWMSGDV